jgi:hypothetical protein
MIDRGARSRRRASTALITILGLLVGLTGGAAAAPTVNVRAQAPPVASSLAEWTGGVNFYRSGVFTTQASWLYCTAADVQIIRNMVEGTSDHSSSAQTTYFDWMRTKNKYDLPLSAGVDPAGWTAGMRHFVDDRYELVSSPSYNGTLRTAVERMRLTNLPVALAVAHGNHGWVLNGFTATADPAVTTDFEITSVSVTGPLWGLQSKNGYDMKPNTKLTVDELATYFTRWHYDPLPMIWDGSFVSIQPAPAAPAPPAATAPAATPPAATPRPTPAPTPPAEPSEPPAPATAPATAPPTAPPEVAIGDAGPSAFPSSAPDERTAPNATEPWPVALALVLAMALILVVIAAVRRSRGPSRGSG